MKYSPKKLAVSGELAKCEESILDTFRKLFTNVLFNVSARSFLVDLECGLQLYTTSEAKSVDHNINVTSPTCLKVPPSQ